MIASQTRTLSYGYGDIGQYGLAEMLPEMPWLLGRESEKILHGVSGEGQRARICAVRRQMQDLARIWNSECVRLCIVTPEPLQACSARALRLHRVGANFKELSTMHG